MDCVGGCNWIIRTRAGGIHNIDVGREGEPLVVPAGRRCGAKCYNGLCWKHSEHGRAAASEKAGRMRIRRRERERAQAAAEQAE